MRYNKKQLRAPGAPMRPGRGPALAALARAKSRGGAGADLSLEALTRAYARDKR